MILCKIKQCNKAHKHYIQYLQLHAVDGYLGTFS